MKNSAPTRLPPPPRHLSAEAKALWKRIVTEFGLVDSPGVALLTAGLEAHDRMREAQAAIAKDGATFRDRFGQLRAHPAVAIERDCRDAWMRAIRQLGFSVEPVGPVGRPAGAHLPKQF